VNENKMVFGVQKIQKAVRNFLTAFQLVSGTLGFSINQNAAQIQPPAIDSTFNASVPGFA
jgi:hypothetical protein